MNKKKDYEPNELERKIMWQFYWKVWNGELRIMDMHQHAVYKHIHHLRFWETFEPINLLKRINNNKDVPNNISTSIRDDRGELREETDGGLSQDERAAELD